MLGRIIEFFGNGLGSGNTMENLRPDENGVGISFTFGNDPTKHEHWCRWETVERWGIDKECWWSVADPSRRDGDG